MIGMLIAGSYSIVDTVFIGQSAGEAGLASVAVTWPLVMLFDAVGDMLGTGAAILISQARGAGLLGRARRILGNMLIAQVLTCLLMMGPLSYFQCDILQFFGANADLMPGAIGYSNILIYGGLTSMLMVALPAVIRNDGRPVLSMWLTITGLLMNIVLDYIFIFPLNGGVEGAGYATLFSQTFVTIAGLVYFATKYTDLRYHWVAFKIKVSVLKDVITSGIPSLGNQLAIITMLFFHNYQSLRYGGIDGLAAYTFIGAIESLGSLLLTGLALGVQPLAAYLFGAKRFQRQQLIGQMGYITAFGLGGILMFISFWGHTLFPIFFNLNGQAAQMASDGLVISSTAFLLLGVIRVAGSYYQATGHVAASSVLIYGDAFFVLPLCLFGLPMWFGLTGVWLAMPVSRVILFGGVLFLWFKDKKSWS